MIVKYLLDAIYTLLTSVFGVLPSLPATPTEVQNIGETATVFIAYPVRVLAYIYGWDLFWIVVGLAILLWQFRRAYHVIMWILRKIPALGLS